MRKVVQSITVIVAFAAGATLSTIQSAPAISADLAKKCRELAIKSHPPVLTGSSKGTAEAERAYFRQCVAKGGNVGNDPKQTQ